MRLTTARTVRRCVPPLMLSVRSSTTSAMSDTNTTVVRQVYEAFVRKDLPSILPFQAEDSEWSVAASSQLIPWAGPFQGRGEGVQSSGGRLGPP